MKIRKKVFYEIYSWIDDPEIIFLIGPRQVGKTTLLFQIQKQIEQEKKGRTFFYTFEDFQFLSACNETPKNLLFDIGEISENEKIYVFLDEIQYLDNPSQFLKYIFDLHKKNIKLIISGSSAFYIDNHFTDSLAGRKIIFPISPLSFPEFLEFSGKKSPDDFSKLPVFRKTEYMNLFEEYSLYGGYPRVVLEKNHKKKETLLLELLNSYLKKDVLEQNIRNIQKFYDFLRILAEQTSQMYNKNELAKTLQVSTSLIENYEIILQKTFFLSFLKPFHRKLKKEITKMPKIFFTDSGIRNMLLRNFSGFRDRMDRGELFEQMCFQLLREKDPDLRFWRTQQGYEIDFILPQKKQAIEVKFNISKTGKEKYKILFQEAYSDFSYQEICFENILEKIPSHS